MNFFSTQVRTVRFTTDSMVWRCFSQQRDTVDNDNRTAEMEVRDAQAMRRWAESRSQDSAFAPMVHAAMVNHQQVMRRHRPR